MQIIQNIGWRKTERGEADLRKYRVTKIPIKISGSIKYRTRDINKRLRLRINEIEKEGQKAYEDIKISDNIDYNFRFLKEIFSGSYDLVLRPITLRKDGKRCFLAFLSGMVDKDIINQYVITPLKSYGSDDIPLLTSEYSEVRLMKDAINQILGAFCVLFIEGTGTAISIGVSNIKTRSVGEAKIEAVLRGPLEAFIEDVNVNVAMIRKRLKTPVLKMEKHEIGKQSKTNVILAYIQGVIDEGILGEVKRRLSGIDIELLLDSGQIQDFIEDDPLSPFPQMEVTERPDVCTAALAEGRFVIFVDGSPFAIIAPTTFSYLFNAAEDYYNRYYYAIAARTIRYAAFFITLVGPSAYIAITTFHPEMLPRTLLISIINARANVPFPALLEALLMEIMFEIIREVAIRLPSSISQALSIVGALVIGQVSVQAGLVSPIMIIVVAMTGLASFLIPKINSARQVSLLRFPMMLFAATMGIFGLIMGGLLLLVHLAALRTFGVPYLSPMAPLNPKGLKDTILKLPAWMIIKKPTYIKSDRGKTSNEGIQYGNESSKSKKGDK